MGNMHRYFRTYLKFENKEQKGTEGKPVARTVIVALICCMVDFGIAQFGLLTLIQKAYSALAYLAIPVILIPYIIHMIVTRKAFIKERAID